METPIVYVIVSDENDLYLQQAILSMYSLRLHNPSARIIVVIDDITNSTLQNDRNKVLSFVSEKIIVERPSGFSKKDTSRYLKTTLRSRISGAYMFLDTDTIVCNDISSIDNFKYPIGAVLDKHVTLEQHPSCRTIEIWAKLADWKIDDKTRFYFNSGVMFVSDTEEVHAFYEKWHNAWLHSRSNGLTQDQPALAIANEHFNLIRELDGTWNCQISDNGLKSLYEARIIHYFASMQEWDTHTEIPFYFRSTEPLVFLKRNKNEISKELEECIKNVKSMFERRVIILSGKNVEMMDTKLFKLIRYLYFKHFKIYSLMDRSLDTMGRIFKAK